MNLAHGDGAIQGDDRGWREGQELVVERDDLGPVGRLDRVRVGVHRVDVEVWPFWDAQRRPQSLELGAPANPHRGTSPHPRSQRRTRTSRRTQWPVPARVELGEFKWTLWRLPSFV